MNSRRNEEKLRLPMLPLRGVVIFPGTVVTLDAARDRSIAAVQEALEGDRKLFVVAQRDTRTENPLAEDLYTAGTIVTVRQIMPMPDHSLRLMLAGESRAVLLSTIVGDSCVYAQVSPRYADALSDIPEREHRAYMRAIVALSRKLAERMEGSYTELLQALAGETLPGALCDSVANALIKDVRTKQRLLEAFDVKLRLESTAQAIGEELDIQGLEEKIQQRVREMMDRANHEYYLREQIRAIQDELGDDEDEEIAEYRRKLAESKMPDDAREKVSRELRRLARTAAQSPESGVSQNYIEYMLELPWGVRDESQIDIARARKVLEEDHYGLKEVKDRLLEYLAVRKSTDRLKSPIICLVGPPGVGKTSIAKSIARALNRKFTQFSLGGVHDEAEIRGHRKTYVGAMPGRIITSIQRCGTLNPVFLLDEVDKIAHDLRGDPAAALLEALDPAQNERFCDHYVEAPFDLSDVLFITTANSTEPIDRALLDRMEVIEVSSYTQDEKCKIAKKYLLPRQLEAHGMKRSQLRTSDKTMLELIDSYTRESGVRGLERCIERLCRKAALAMLENPERKQITLRSSDLKTYLGAQRFLRQPTAGKAEVGIVNGLAWTSVGGEVMPVECAVMDGKGTVEVTGRLGEVMQESAKLARSIARMRAEKYGIAADFFDKHDIHIHVPEGATPKDGPSAGVALSCAVLSAISGLPASGELAMTGEVTLHGRVLPIGGVREKLLAAHRMGITRILLPRENEKDLEEIDAATLSQLEVTLIDSVDDALKLVLTNPNKMRLAI